MFENDHIDDFDLKVRSILEAGQEDVPAGLWEGISAGIDRAERRKTVFMWVRRTGVAVAAAAAVVAGVVLNVGNGEDIVSPAAGSDMIAVVQQTDQQDTPEQGDKAPMTLESATLPDRLIAYQAAPAPESPAAGEQSEPAETAAPYTETSVSAPTGTSAAPTGTSVSQAGVVVPQNDGAQEQSEPDGTACGSQRPDDRVFQTDIIDDQWEDDTPQRRRIKTSITFSGVAGTNGTNQQGALNPLKSPALDRSYTKTTVEQTGAQTTYGIPVSLGTGVKINFTRRWALGVGLNYTLLTSRFNGKYIKVNDDGTHDTPKSANVRNLQHFVGIPINAYYNIISRDFINFYAYAGGAVEKCVSNSYQVHTTPMVTHNEIPKGVQLSANAGIGVEFLLGKYVGLYIDPSLRYYFNCNQPKSIRTDQPLMLGFEVGARFNL